MHMNHRPIVPVKNAAEMAYEKVTAISLHTSPSILSRLDAREIFKNLIIEKFIGSRSVHLNSVQKSVTRKNGKKNFTVVGTGFQNEIHAE